MTGGRVSVLIPHAEGAARLERCLDSLRSESIRQVVVVLPAAGEASARVVERHPRGLPVRTQELLSFARATNLAASRASGELLLLLNDDTVVAQGAIERLAAALDERPGAAIAAPMLLNPDGSEQPSVYADPSWRAFAEMVMRPVMRLPRLAHRATYPRREPRSGTVSGAWVSAAALMIRRAVYEDCGGLDEGYPHGIEDAALCAAVRGRGHDVVFVREARVVHEGGVSGFMNRTDSRRVARALLAGTRGWLRYWSTVRGAGAVSARLLWSAFVLFGLSRVVATDLLAAVARGPAAAAYELRRDAYRRYLRGLLAMRPGELG